MRQGEIYGCKVRTVLTEVVNDSNIQYLNPDDDDEPGVQLYVTQVSSIYHLTLYNKNQFFSVKLHHLPFCELSPSAKFLV